MVRQWRTNLTQLHALLDRLVDQLADGWTLLVEDAGRAATPRTPADRATRRDLSVPFLTTSQSEPVDALDGLEELDAPDPMERTLWQQAQQAAIWQAPAGFTLRVRMRLPADPPPFDVVTSGPYDQLHQVREHARLVFGALSVSALLTFGSSWLIAIVEPSLAFTILATLVSLVLLLAQSLRFAWETAAGAASNPVLLLLAMSAPVVGFLVVATQLPRWSERLGGLREA